jgi:hypothetical protein
MSETPVLGSLNKTLAEKKLAKYDPALEKKVRTSLAILVPEHKEALDNEKLSLQDVLKDGIILCKFMNKIAPNKIPRVNTMQVAFKQMENIANYLKACAQIGLTEVECFETNDLFEGRDLMAVLNNLNAFLNLHEKHGDQLLDQLKQRPTATETRTEPKSPSTPAPRINTIKAVTPTASPPDQKGPSTLGKKTLWGQSTEALASPTTASVSSLEHDIQTKEEFKYIPELERTARQWIEAVTGIKQPDQTFPQYLKSGIVLCKLINTVKPNAVTKVNEGTVAYKQMENIEHYLKACSELGLHQQDLFNTSDLFNEKNVNLVINSIHVFAHFIEKLPNYDGPRIENPQTARNLFSASLVEGSASDFLTEDPNAVPETLTPEQQELLDWSNAQLRKFDTAFKLKNLTTDVRDGVKLIKLLEVVTKGSQLGSYTKQPKLLWHCMQNAALILRFLAQQTFEKVQCRATDIVMGNLDAVVRLLTFIRNKFDLDYMFKKLIAEAYLTPDDVFFEETEEVIQVPDEDISHLKEEPPVVILIPATPVKTTNTTVTTVRKTSQPQSPVAVLKPAETSTTSQNPTPVKETPTTPITVQQPQTTQTAPQTPTTPTTKPIDIPSPRDSPASLEPSSPKTDSPLSRSRDKSPSRRDKKGKEKQKKSKDKDKKSKEKKSRSKDKKSSLASSGESPASMSSEQLSDESRSSRKHDSPRRDKPLNVVVTSAPDTPTRTETVVTTAAATTTTETPAGTPQQPATQDTAVSRLQGPLAASDSAVAQPHAVERERTVSISADNSNNPVLRRLVRSHTRIQTSEPEKLARVAKAQGKMRQHVANELLQTERSYVRSLSTLAEGLISPLMKANVMSETELSSAFSNIVQLLDHHKGFCDVLSSRLASWNDDSIISDIFLDRTKFFLDYEPYLTNYNSGMIAIHYFKKKYNKFNALLTSFEEEQMNTTMLNTESFLIMPIQRLPRYVLLLRDIRKYTPPSQEHAAIGDAISWIERTLSDLNSKIKFDAEKTKKVLAIAESIEGEENLLKNSRFFVREGVFSVKKIAEKKDKKGLLKEGIKKVWDTFTKKKVNPYWFLFNDLLVYCDFKSSAKTEERKPFTFLHSLPLGEVREVIEVAKKGKDTEFQVVLETEVWKMSCTSAEDRNTWVAEIRRCLDMAPSQSKSFSQ